MAFKGSAEKRVEGEGYYTSSVFSARDMFENIESAIEDSYFLEESYPQAYGDTKVFKVTLTIEEV